jgi:hypothetical protein
VALRSWLLMMALGGWGLRLLVLSRQNIWWDEARNIDVALRPLAQVAIAPELDIHPPFYFWLLHGWMWLMGVVRGMDPAEMAFLTRLLSVAAGVIGVVLVAQLARRAGGKSAAAVAALLAAASPFWLGESQETRMYTVGFALLTAAAVMWLQGWQRAQAGARGWRVWAGFVGLSALALLTHYNAVFIVAAWYAGWLALSLAQAARVAHLRAWLLSGMATAALLLPIAPIALRQIPGYANPNLTVPTPWEFLRLNWQAYVGGYAYDPALGGDWGDAWLGLVVALLATGLAWAWWRRAAATELPVTLGLLLVWVVGGSVLYYAAVVDRGAFNVRYSSFVTPALYVLLGCAAAGWGRLWRPLGGMSAVAMVALWPWAIQADLVDARFYREDIAGVTAWLAASAGPEDVILVDQKYPFGFYYERYTLDPSVSPVGAEAAPAAYMFVDINTIDAPLTAFAGEARTVYWVQWFESDTDPRKAVSFLLGKQGQWGGEAQFHGYTVNWWTLTPPTVFDLAPAMTPLSVRFADAVRTVEASIPSAPVQAGDKAPVVVRWERVPGGTVTRPLKARVALYTETGDRVAQSDERLLNDRHLLPAEWGEADRPLNVYLLELPAELPPGRLTLGLLVYDAETLDALAVRDAAGGSSSGAAGIEYLFAAVDVVGQE